MRACELFKEYNKDLRRTNSIDISMIEPRLKKSIGPIGAIGVSGFLHIFYYEEMDQCFYILTNEDKSEICGYIWLQYVSNDIWQVKDAVIQDSGKGIGTNLYHFIVRVGNDKQGVKTKRLIHDTQLSPPAEKLWKINLVKKGLIRKIYDRELDKIYPEDSIGSQTSDGVDILNPEDDTVDTIQDYSHSSMRFFWLVESNIEQPKIHPLRNRFLKEGLTSEIYEEVLERMRDKTDPEVSSWIWFAYNINMPGEF